MAVERRRTIGFWVLALLLNLGSVLFPMFRETRLWLPQGRYLYPSILPIAMLLTAGWQSWIPARWQQRGAMAVFIGGWVALDALVILFYIVPHYYGRIM
jgi:ABC-type Na+ efflux pump permease subunit